MLQESLIYNWICGLCAYLGKYLRQSLTVRTLFKCGRAIKAAFGGSGIAAFIWRDGAINQYAEGSLLYRMLDSMINLPARISQGLYQKLKPALKHSVLARLLSYMMDRLHVLIALFLVAVLIIRHADWFEKFSLISTITILLLFVLFLFKTLRDGGRYKYMKSLDAFLLLFAVCVPLSLVFSILPGSGLNVLSYYFNGFLLVFLMVMSIKTTRQLTTVLQLILVAISLCGMYGIYQGIMGLPVKASEVDLIVNEGMPGRVFSTMGNSNNFGEVLVILLPFYMAIIFNSRKTLTKLFFMALALPPLIALGMTYFRGGWIGLVVAAFVYVFFKDIRLIPLLLVLGALMIPFLPISIYKRILTIFNPEDTSSDYRVQIYQTVWPILKDYWVTGLGLGNDTLRKVMPNYYLFTKAIPPHSHNVYLQVWFEMGIAGFLSLLAFFASVVKRTTKAIYTSVDKEIKNILISGIASLLGILTISLAEYTWYYARVMLMFWALIGIILAALNIARAASGKKEMAAESSAEEDASAA